MPTPLSVLTASQIETALDHLPGWTFADNSLHRTLKFADFRQAIGFIVRLSFEAEQRNHHPDLRNVYSTVEISLSTHDAGNQVTRLDVDLAQAINSLL